MISFHGRTFSLMILYAISLHLAWSVILLFDASAMNATAVHALIRWGVSSSSLAAIIAACALMALFALFLKPTWALMLLLPQQILLMMSASGAIDAIWIAQFADGVVRDRGFIAADQLYSVLAAAGHTLAIIRHAMHSNHDR